MEHQALEVVSGKRPDSQATRPHGRGRFTFAITTFGCQMNVADCDDLAVELARRGGVRVESPEKADLVLVNTCVVRHTAEDRVKSYIGRLRHLKENGRQPFIAVMGCLVPKEKQTLPRRFPHIDRFVLRSTPSLVLREIEPFLERVGATEAVADYRPEFDEAAGHQSLGKVNAFVTVQRGCSKYCTFCIVPYVKGRERSEPPWVVFRQVRRAIAEGYPMVTLLGQSIMTYGRDREEFPNFAGLVKAVSSFPGLIWLNFLTSHPADLTDEVIYEVLTLPNLVPYLHLPIQAGSDRILERMNRRYTVAEYLEKIDKVRRVRPDIFLSTDVIVGFPGETREEFEQTLRLMEEVQFNDAFMFKYSPRKYTKAYKEMAAEELPEAEKHTRLVELIERQKEISRRVNRRYVGRVVECVVEEHRPDETIARTPWTKPVHLPLSPELAPRSFVRVRITGVRVSTFEGELV